MNILFISPPGAGKGTQSELLQQKYNLYPISSGAIIRKKMNDKSLDNGYLKKAIKDGDLINDNMMLELIKNELFNDNNLNKYNGFVFDGFPRNINQAKLLTEFFLETGISLDYIVHLDIDYELAKSRILSRLTCINCGKTDNLKNFLDKEKICNICGSRLVSRLDDNLKSLDQRFETYNNETKHLLSYYDNDDYIKKVYVKIIEDENQYDVFNKIIKIIEEGKNGKY